jgi:hypothetical protein
VDFFLYLGKSLAADSDRVAAFIAAFRPIRPMRAASSMIVTSPEYVEKPLSWWASRSVP